VVKEEKNIKVGGIRDLYHNYRSREGGMGFGLAIRFF